MTLRDQGELNDAIRDFAQAIEIESQLVEKGRRSDLANELAEDHYLLGSARVAEGQIAAALKNYEKSIEIRSRIIALDVQRETRVQLVRDLTTVAWILATNSDGAIRNGDKAKEYALKACELSEWKAHVSLQALAAAFAETGNFVEALKWQKTAINLAPNKFKDQLGAALALYQLGKPFWATTSPSE
jgi:tetratricopeptide (TPR) repeat protein